MKNQKESCRHDYKNAIQVGNIDYQCCICGKLLDPMEWFLMNSFEFIEVGMRRGTKSDKNSTLKVSKRV